MKHRRQQQHCESTRRGSGFARKLSLELLEDRRMLAIDFGLLKDINPFVHGSAPHQIAEVGSVAFFAATSNDEGMELWKSDGTAAGTVLVKDINAGALGAVGSGPHYLTNVGGTLYFCANDGTNGKELWKSDGTAGGTVLVKDIYPGASESSPRYLTNVGGTLFFTAVHGTSGIELWKSDGTEAGTVLVKDIWPGIYPSIPRYLTNVGGHSIFQRGMTHSTMSSGRAMAPTQVRSASRIFRPAFLVHHILTP